MTLKSISKKMIFIITLLISLSVIAWEVADRTYRAHLNFRLYHNEELKGGSRAAELAEFAWVRTRILWAQEILRVKNLAKGFGGESRRVFHAKPIACAVGKLVLNNSRPGDVTHRTYRGMFNPARKRTYDVIIRYSNGLGIINHDREPDVRGMAIKVFDVYNDETGKFQNVDLTMTNSPTPFGRDTAEFVDFMEEIVKHGPTLGAVAFAAKHPVAGAHLIKATGTLPYGTSYPLYSTRFWGGHAYLLGPNDAMKFNVEPYSMRKSTVDVVSVTAGHVKEFVDGNFPKPQLGFFSFGIGTDGTAYHNYYDYLRQELWLELLRRPVRYKLNLQLETNDPSKTPIEDNNNEWEESESPSITVGDIIIEKQSPHNIEICDRLRFTPGNYIPAHRPLSNMGRGRIFSYDDSQNGRRAQIQEFDRSIYEELRDKNYVGRWPY